MKKSVIFAVVFCVAISVLFSSCKSDPSGNSSQSSLQDILSGYDNQSKTENGEESQAGENQAEASSDIKDNSSNNQNISETDTSSGKNQQTTSTDSSAKQETASNKPQNTQTSSVASSNKPSNTTTTSSASGTNISVKPISPDEYYGWKELQKIGTQAELQAYQLFREQIGKYQKEVTFDFNITKEEAERAYNYYRDDYPQHFWRGNSIYFTISGGYIKKISLSSMLYGGDAAKLKEMNDKVIAASEKILSKIKGSMSLIERQIFIHNTLVNNIKYDTTFKAENTHNMYGALVNGKAVCEGYAYAFQYLAREAGIQCIAVKGDLNGLGGWEAHAWNMVELDGEYYHIDVTSDDPIVDGGADDILEFTYFNLTDSEIKKDHKITDNSHSIPAANSTKYNFFRYYGLKFNELSVNNFAKAFAFAAKNKYEYAYLAFNGCDLSNVGKYLGSNYRAIASGANDILGKEVLKSVGSILYFNNTDFNLLSVKLSYN